jgi:signal transduction histidine kinase
MQWTRAGGPLATPRASIALSNGGLQAKGTAMLASFRSHQWIAYVAGIFSVVAVWAATSSVSPILKDHISFYLFFLAVSLAAWLGGFWPGLCTAIVSTVVGNFHYFQPYGSLRISSAEEAESLFVFFVVSVIISILAESSRRALIRARTAERAKDDFMATVAHELRSPLSVIHYANELDRISSDDTSRDHIDLIDQQVQHLNRMVQDLLDVSRIARGKIRLERKHVDAAEIVDGAVIKAMPTIEGRRHELIVEVVDDSIPLYVDAVRMQQVLANLLVNAAKYTPDGGRIGVRVESAGDMATFTVRDNGIGISEDLLPQVFDAYVQADARSKSTDGGLGIGLALVRKVVELHGGCVNATSAGPNRGSVFTVSLPLAAKAVASLELVEAQ